MSISDGRRHPGMEHWVPLFHAQMETLLDYLPRRLGQPGPPGRGGADRAPGDDRRPLRRPAGGAARRRGAVPAAAARPAVSRPRRLGRDAVAAARCSRSARSPGRMAPSASTAAAGPARSSPRAECRSAPARHQRVRPACAPRPSAGRNEGRRIVIAAWTRGSRERLAHPAARARLQGRRAGRRLGRRPPQGIRRSVSLVTLGVERGFVADAASRWSASRTCWASASAARRARRKRADQFIAEATEIAEGDLVVHQEYGIGRYDGLETLTRRRRAA